MQTELPSTSLVVSIHDVSTVTREKVQRILDDLAITGVAITSLLVIPDHHHKGRIDADSSFSTWLRAKIAQGHEPVLHGFFHLRPAQSEESLATRLITRSYTAGEGEFYDLSFSEASALLKKGRELLLECGTVNDGSGKKTTGFTDFNPDGFIAPAWLLSSEAERAVRDEGFGYTTRIGTVIDCIQGASHASRSMVYSVRAPWRRLISLFWNAWLFRRLRKAPLLRIGIHPPDWDHQAIRKQILSFIRQAAAKRKTTTYREWIAEQRDVSLDQSRSSVH